MVGMFSAVRYDIRTRTREFGIRLALGGPPRSIIWTAMWGAVGPMLLGLAVGLVCTIVVWRALTFPLVDTSTLDPLAIAMAAAVLAGAGSAVAWLAGRAVTKVNVRFVLGADVG